MNGRGVVGYNKAPRNISTNPNFPQRGSVGGEDRNSGSISVGHDGGGTDTYPVQNADGTTTNQPIYPTKNDGSASSLSRSVVGGDPNQWTPWGPEYECQYVNPSVSNANGNPFTNAGDYGTPYYLAGVDDQSAFSGYDPTDQSQAANFGEPNFRFSGFEPPRRAAPQQTGGPTASDASAQWLQMQRVPAGQQDNQGGVLYYVTWRVPTAVSDFYLDVIAYDKARFPGLPSNTSPFSNPQSVVTDNTGATPTITPLTGDRPDNWRIFDNIWGFTTATFTGSNDILVVSDNALGQKFVAPAFQGSIGSSNLVSKQFGAESYVTDVDRNILPNSVYYGFAQPAVPGPDGRQTRQYRKRRESAVHPAARCL